MRVDFVKLEVEPFEEETIIRIKLDSADLTSIKNCRSILKHFRFHSDSGCVENCFVIIVENEEYS